MTSPYRIAPLLDDPFELPEDLPGRTESGDVWIRWANVGSYSGWYAVGTRLPDPVPSRFWDRVFTLGARVGNGHMDAVHVIGPGVLSLGALGMTASSGQAQKLLGMCMLDSPMFFMESMAPALFASGVYPHFSVKIKDGSAWGFADRDRQHVAPEYPVRCGSDSALWIPESKKRAALWVECCSKLLRASHFDRVQRDHLEESAVALLSEDSRNAIRWPRYGARDAWQWTAEQQAVWAVAMVMAIADPEETGRMIRRAAQPDAMNTLRAMKLTVTGNFDEDFARRASAALRGAEELFQVKLKTGEG